MSTNKWSGIVEDSTMTSEMLTLLDRAYRKFKFNGESAPTLQAFRECIEKLPVAILSLPDGHEINGVYYSEHLVEFTGANSTIAGRMFLMYADLLTYTNNEWNNTWVVGTRRNFIRVSEAQINAISKYLGAAGITS